MGSKGSKTISAFSMTTAPLEMIWTIHLSLKHVASAGANDDEVTGSLGKRLNLSGSDPNRAVGDDEGNLFQWRDFYRWTS